ncbi:MAG: hypothetical protein IJO39_09295 [Clostridia bacterium]|nr:hypothetical protein [Clostridia bacterium]
MKNTLTRMLLLAAALVLAMSLCLVHAEETTEEAAEVSTTAYLFWQDEDWWPAVGRNEDEYWTPTPATVTGEGYYTVAVQGHMPGWFYPSNSNRGAQKLAVVIKDGATLFPGYYMQITDIRINGVSYPCGDVTYAQTGYDNADGANIFWSANDSYGLIYDQWMLDNNGTTGGATWNSAGVPEKYDVFDVSVLNNPGSIEIDFFLSAQQDVKPAGGPALRVIGEGPKDGNKVAEPSNLPTVPENATTASLYYQADGWWPVIDGALGSSETVTISGEGEYSVKAAFTDQGGWTPSGNGALKLWLVVENGSNGQGTIMDGMYLGVSDVRVNGASIALNGTAGYGNTGYDSEWNKDAAGNMIFTANDGYSVLYDDYVSASGTLPWGHETWDGSEGTPAVITPGDLANVNNIEVDFFVTDEQGKLPEPWAPEWEYKWYPDNTMGVAGISLRDKGITDKWYNVVPVDLTTNGIYEIPMVASNMFQIGIASVAVQDGQATVTYETSFASPGRIVTGDECVAWFGSIEEITDEFCDAPTSEIAFGEAVDVSAFGDVGYQFICNGVTYSQPVTNNGVSLPQYLPKEKQWVDYRAALEALMAPAAEEAPAEEVPAE